MYIGTVRGMCLNLHVVNLCLNSVVDTRLEVKIFRRKWDEFGRAVSDPMMRLETQFQPTFGLGDQVMLLDRDETGTYTTEGLAAHLIKVFAQHVQTEITSAED